MSTEQWEDYLAANDARFVDELSDFLTYASISSLPEHTGAVADAAQWVADRLTQAGIENVSVLPTGGHPVVYGDWCHAPDKPTVLIYGHFDTQPVDPLALWTRPPFEPHIQDERIYARGASDDKGNMLIPILAVEALLETRRQLPLNIKFLFEGQEEIGSPQLPEVIDRERARLACDLVVSADGGQWAEGQPALHTSLRGLCALEIRLTGARSDLHSGSYGGAVLNPIQALCELLAELHDDRGRVTVEGFYDDVRPLDAHATERIRAVPFDADAFKAGIGVPALHGEADYTTYERLWTRPTLEINGIWGGFQGEGTKTVLPSLAHAKITCRLVADQDPERICRRVGDHLIAKAPAAVRIDVRPEASHAWPYQIAPDHPGNQAAAAVHRRIFGREPHIVGMGGSIPVCGIFLRTLDAYTVNFAFGLKDENVHAPDEFFRLSSFRLGQRAYVHLLDALSRSAF
ncbi:MAG: dipeptidase [Desulfosarcinaceae bacterium]|nr:dipeptidase [Desulfosarcinaceae bacterium]